LTAIDHGLLSTRMETRWCPGCGDYAALDTVQALIPTLGLGQIVVYSGIGCGAGNPNPAGDLLAGAGFSTDIDGVHAIHGQPPSAASSLATRRPDLSVWIVIRDGHTMTAGGNELIKAMQSNVNIKILLYDNQPDPLSLDCGISFLGRVQDADRATLIDVLSAAGRHRGAALIQVRPKGQRISPAGILRQVQH
jgi:2-oxoglutarate ferredoxin oxidoreductase subunit beta